MKRVLWAVPLLLAGCLVPPTNPADIADYNKQVVELLTPFITPLVTLLGVLALWIKSNWDKSELAHKTEMAAQQLAESSQARSQRVLEKVEEAKEINVTALNAANNTNEKILALHQTVAEHTRRASARATDTGTVVVAVPAVQKVEITGPGVDSALKVEEAK